MRQTRLFDPAIGEPESSTPLVISATKDELRAAVTRALMKLGHRIERRSVTLFQDPNEDGNALKQLTEALIGQLTALATTGDRRAQD